MEGLYESKPDRFLEIYRQFLMNVASYHDLINENSYHSLLLGICAYLSNDYTITSNKQEEQEKRPSILEEQCEIALKQIKDNRYDIDLSGKIIHIALAHSTKEVEMKWMVKEIV